MPTTLDPMAGLGTGVFVNADEWARVQSSLAAALVRVERAEKLLVALRADASDTSNVIASMGDGYNFARRVFVACDTVLNRAALPAPTTGGGE